MAIHVNIFADASVGATLLIDPLDYKFDANLLAEDLERFSKGVALSGDSQLSLSNTTDTEDLFEGTGRGITPNGRLDPNSFNRLVPRILGTYTESVIHDLGWKIGRIRYMFLQPKKCYSMHVDGGKFRYHIPIISNNQSYAVYADHGCFTMPDLGRLYRMRVDVPHSAINGGKEVRVHLLFDTMPHLSV